MKIRIADIIEESVVDGPGIRLTIFTQGCFRNCPGCHNPQTHNPKDGKDIEISEILAMLDEDPLLSGITLSGGEPFLQAEKLSKLADETRKRGLTVMAYSGYTFEELQNDALPGAKDLLSRLDILVDGPYLEERRNLELRFRGSENQRCIDVPASLGSGKVKTLWERDEDAPKM